MTYRVVHHGAHKDREGWLLARRDYVGASEVAALLGPPYAAPWHSRADLAARKLGLEPPDQDDPDLAMHWGTHLEAGIIAGMANPAAVHCVSGEPTPPCAPNPWGQMLVNDAFPGLSATPDAFSGQTVIEIKNPGPGKLGFWKSGPPPSYIAQLQAQLAITGYPYGWIAALFGNRGPVMTWGFEADPVLHTRMREAVAEFWDLVKDLRGTQNYRIDVDTPTERSTIKQ